jgi:hypothetical protein
VRIGDGNPAMSNALLNVTVSHGVTMPARRIYCGGNTYNIRDKDQDILLLLVKFF